MSWAPSRKWWVATVVALGTLGTAFAEAGDWSSTLTITAIGIAVGRFSAWMLPNGDDEAPSREELKAKAKGWH